MIIKSNLELHLFVKLKLTLSIFWTKLKCGGVFFVGGGSEILSNIKMGKINLFEFN